VIALDTNVISEAMRGPAADRRVLTWLRGLRERPVTTVINRAEVLAGILVLAPGQRRDGIEAEAKAAFDGLAACLSLAPSSADHYASIVSESRRRGRPIAPMDGLVAAIVRDFGATLATRNIDDFVGLGIELINPWA